MLVTSAGMHSTRAKVCATHHCLVTDTDILLQSLTLLDLLWNNGIIIPSTYNVYVYVHTTSNKIVITHEFYRSAQAVFWLGRYFIVGFLNTIVGVISVVLSIAKP